MPRFLFGPSDDASLFDRFLSNPVAAGDWTTFSAITPSWDAALAGSKGAAPDALLLWPGYGSVPAWVWSAPVPVVALAHDPNLLWHGFRHLLPLADLILTDAPSAARLQRAGVQHVRAANLFGLDRHFAAEIDTREGTRDIDVLFVGNINPAVQSARLPWLGRLAWLGARWNVVIAAGVFGAEYRALLRRAKVVFNRSIRGECNLRALEAAASGAVLVQEAENDEVKDYLEPGVEYAPYTETDFEAVIESLLADRKKRWAITEAAMDRARWWTFEALVASSVGVGGKGWAEVRERAHQRAKKRVAVSLTGRVWQRASVVGPDADPHLIANLTTAGERHSLGVLASTTTEAEPHLAASARGNRVSAVSHAVALAGLGRMDEALTVLKAAVAALDAEPALNVAEAESVPYPARFYWVRVGWERAGFDHAGDPKAERAAKARLLRGRALALVAELTGAVADHAAAVACCPEQPHLRAALGAAFVRTGKLGEAIEHLRLAVTGNPFDRVSTGLFINALVVTGQEAEAERVREHWRLLTMAAPKLAPELVPTPEPSPAPEPVETNTSTLEHDMNAAPFAPVEVSLPVETSAPEPVAEQPASAVIEVAPPALVSPAPAPANSPPRGPRARFVDMTREQFTARFGSPDTSQALCGFTPAHDTHAVLTLVDHFNARRVLEVGTAAGHMTANLTVFTPPDAVVYSLGVVAEDDPKSGTPNQDYEIPKRDQFAKFVNHFGTAHKALLITADSRTYDFARLAPLDLAFIDGGHDFETARSDSLAAYKALRPGGCLVWHDLPSSTRWVEVERAVASLPLAESVYKIAGTQVAFLIKGEGVGAAAGADSARVAVTWDGEIDAVHSLAHVNRSVCAELVARGHAVGLVRPPVRTFGATPAPLPPELAAQVGLEVPGAVEVRHRWPPDFNPPAGSGPFVLMQPWEFGRLPREWVEPILARVDEVWAYSRAVLRAYVASGVPEDRVALVPLGIDPERFRPGLTPLPLATAKGTKLLFVGGTIPRKGFDVLLGAYRRAFTRADDVCLVVKDVGAGTFYRDQTAEQMIRVAQNDPDTPEVLHLTEDLGEAELPRLFAACDALVHPYRGEGFGLPILEAMACGLPVVVTAGGVTDEFVPLAAGWRVPARLRYFEREAVGDLATAGHPWWLEPDADALVAILKEVVANASERAARGAAGRRAALGWTWARTASAVEDRVRVLRTRTPVRFRLAATPARPTLPAAPSSAPAFNPAVTLRADEPFVVPAMVQGAPRLMVPAVVGRKPRVSLTMIVRNEEHNLGACLASVRDLVDEAVVVDTGSTDRTVEIAKSFGCVVGSFPWIDHFAAARNAALENATGDYAFWMDADDRLDEDNRVKLRSLFAGLTGSNNAFVMKCLCVGAGPGAGATAVDHVRLFRLHDAHRWTYRVHEQILPALRATGAEVGWSEVCVRHVGYIDAAVRRRKLDRDLRLLNRDEAEKPGDPFTLFNLGSVYHEVGDFKAAATALEKSLAGSHVKDSIVRKTYALLARCHRQSGDRNKAETTCRRGRQHYPDDAELVFLSAGFAREAGDVGAAEGLYRKLIDGSEGPHFASVDTGLRAVKGRHNLAVLLLEQNRLSEAEGLWRAALSHDPHFLPAQTGLGEVAVKAGNGPAVERQLVALEELGEAGAAEAAILRARWKGERGDLAGAGAVLEEAVTRLPNALGVRIALSHARIAADAPPELLEAAFRGVLELDLHNEQAKRNLDVLYRKTGRRIEGVLDGSGPPPSV